MQCWCLHPVPQLYNLGHLKVLFCIYLSTAMWAFVQLSQPSSLSIQFSAFLWSAGVIQVAVFILSLFFHVEFFLFNVKYTYPCNVLIIIWFQQFHIIFHLYFIVVPVDYLISSSLSFSISKVLTSYHIFNFDLWFTSFFLDLKFFFSFYI